MAYRVEKNLDTGNRELVIDGWKNGIAASPYEGIANIQNLNTSYYPGVAYVNYARQAITPSGVEWFAGTHSTNVSGNLGWMFTAPTSTVMSNPVQKATSPAGLHYILDDLGQVWKQTAVNSTAFTELEDGMGRVAHGAGGVAYWNNYLVVFGAGVIEFCGDGTGDSGILSTNWNIVNSTSGVLKNTAVFTTDFMGSTTNMNFDSNSLPIYRPRFAVNDPVQFTTTGTLPTGLSLSTTYYIKTLVVTGTTYFTVSATVGGSAVTFSDNGSGTHTVTDYINSLPIGNYTSVSMTNFVIGSSTATLTSYVDTRGTTVTGVWWGPTGIFDIVMSDGQKIPASFTFGSASVTLLSPTVYVVNSSNWTIQLLDTVNTSYRPYVSKVDGSLLFCNGQFVGRIAETSSPNTVFNPGLPASYSVSFGVTSIPQEFDIVVDMVDLKNSLVVAGTYNTYVWDYLSAQCSAPSPIGEQIFKITNLLNNIYVLAGQKGSIYVSNGYSSQLLLKMPDFVAGIIDAVWSWGGVMTHRSKLFFQALAKTTSGTSILAGVFSLTVSPTMIGEQASALAMEAQNSYGLTPATGALSNGLLMDNSPSANGNDSYYSVWSNGASTGGVDYNDTTLWQNWEPTIETDIIPIGTLLNKQTFGLIEFKLDRPLATGDQIRMYWRPSLTDSYVLMGTTTTAALLSETYKSNITQAQWVQFKIQMKCASSGSSFIPLREVRLHFN